MQARSPKALGFRGEAIAAEFLQSKGYEMLTRNFTIRGGEIDLVARHNDTLVFVEVKSRTSESFGRGEESFNGQKTHRMSRAIERYLDRHARGQDSDYRIDLVEIELHRDSLALKNIQHFEDVDYE